MIPYCWVKKKKSHIQNTKYPQNQPLFTRKWRLKCAQDLPCRIRIRELLLRKELGNCKYDTKLYFKRLLKIIILQTGKFGVCVNILYHLLGLSHILLKGGFFSKLSQHYCQWILSSTAEVLGVLFETIALKNLYIN